MSLFFIFAYIESEMNSCDSRNESTNHWVVNQPYVFYWYYSYYIDDTHKQFSRTNSHANRSKRTHTASIFDAYEVPKRSENWYGRWCIFGWIKYARSDALTHRNDQRRSTEMPLFDDDQITNMICLHGSTIAAAALYSICAFVRRFRYIQRWFAQRTRCFSFANCVLCVQIQMVNKRLADKLEYHYQFDTKFEWSEHADVHPAQ